MEIVSFGIKGNNHMHVTNYKEHDFKVPLIIGMGEVRVCPVPVNPMGLNYSWSVPRVRLQCSKIIFVEKIVLLVIDFHENVLYKMTNPCCAYKKEMLFLLSDNQERPQDHYMENPHLTSAPHWVNNNNSLGKYHDLIRLFKK